MRFSFAAQLRLPERHFKGGEVDEVNCATRIRAERTKGIGSDSRFA